MDVALQRHYPTSRDKALEEELKISQYCLSLVGQFAVLELSLGLSGQMLLTSR